MAVTASSTGHPEMHTNDEYVVTAPRWNAQGDGTTDDTAAIQAAVAAAPAGSVLSFPAGKSFLIGDVDIATNFVTLTGGGTIIKKSGSTYAIHLTGQGQTIDGLQFQAQSTSGQPNSDIKLGDGSSDILITNCYFRGATYSAVAAAVDTEASGAAYSTAVSGVIISNNRFRDQVAGSTRYSRTLHLHSVENLTISGNVIRGGAFDAIRLRENDGYVIIDGNQFISVGDQTWPDEQTRDAIDTLWSGQKLIISNNIIYQPAYHGLDLKGSNLAESINSEEIVVTGNHIEGARYSGIRLSGSASATHGGANDIVMYGADVSHNTIIGCNREASEGSTVDMGNAAILVIGFVQHSSIAHNRVFRNFARGIYLRNTKTTTAVVKHVDITKNKVVNNGLTGETSHGILIQGSSYIDIDGNTCESTSEMGNDEQDYGILLNSAADAFSNTPVAASNRIRNNTCVGHGTADILTDPNTDRANSIGHYHDNIVTSVNRAAWQGVQRVMHGTSAPLAAEGDFLRGDIVLNSAPATGNPIGWMCEADGNPGTWTALANL